MNPKAFFLIVLGVVVILAVIIGIGYWIAARRAGVNRKEFKRVREDRNLAIEVIKEIRGEVAIYSDIDSPLAAKLRPILNQYESERIELYK